MPQETYCGRRESTHTYLKSTVRICKAGLHLSFRISRQILPSCTRIKETSLGTCVLICEWWYIGEGELRGDLINVRMVYLGEKPNLFQTNIIKQSPRVLK